MKRYLKPIVVAIANITFSIRGLRFPSYFDDSDRIFVMLHNIEPDVIKATRAILKPGMVAIDIGANVGFMSRLFAKAVGKTGKVIAFEPGPETMIYLRHNTRAFPQVELSEIALSDQNTTAKLHINPRSGTSNSIVRSEATHESVDVTCRTLDDFLSERGMLVPDLIKIDVEGAELKVLAGMNSTLLKCPKVRIIVEFCPRYFTSGVDSTLEFYEFLIKHGFSISILHKTAPPIVVTSHENLIQSIGDLDYVNLLCVRPETKNKN